MGAVQQAVVDGTDAPLFVDVGSIWPWATSCLCFPGPGRLHLETAVGSMGLAVAAGVGAALVTRRRTVVLTGDWSFDMALPEVRMAVDRGAPVLWVVHQTFGGQMVLDGDRCIHGRTDSSASFAGADLAGAVRALGCPARRIDEESALLPSLEAALSSGGPFLLEVVADTSEAPPYGGRFDALRGSVRR
jgi:acetolactate synthase-1/2/3 large subunit